MHLLQNFPLSSKQQEKLKAAGFDTVDDLRGVTVSELSNELLVSSSEALEILDAVFGAVNSSLSARGKSALELLKAEQLQTSIITFSAKIDEILGGGISMGKITEICGAPGIGKTQFSMQLAVDVCIPEAFGGIDGEAIFIDTEGSFIVERVAEIATAAVRHIASVANTTEEREEAQRFSVEVILRGMHYFRCHDYVELVALVNLLPQILTQKPKVRLIVIDSIASPFRHGFEDMGMRNRILGESWGHACTVRVVLFWQQSQRCAMLYKSPSRKQMVASFQVTEDGVRDLCDDGLELSQDAKALRELVSLSSSQLEDIDNSAGDGYEEVEDEELEKQGEKETFYTPQLLRSRGDQSEDQVLPLSTAKESNESGSSRKRGHPGF